MRDIIDTGPQLSYILKRSAIEMKCQRVSSEALVEVLFGGVSSKFIIVIRLSSHLKQEVNLASYKFWTSFRSVVPS